MERELFSIEPSASGWDIYQGAMSAESDLTQMEALEHATVMAQACHARSGRPTGVTVRMQCGDTVLLACHG